MSFSPSHSFLPAAFLYSTINRSCWEYFVSWGRTTSTIPLSRIQARMHHTNSHPSYFGTQDREVPPCLLPGYKTTMVYRWLFHDSKLWTRWTEEVSTEGQLTKCNSLPIISNALSQVTGTLSLILPALIIILEFLANNFLFFYFFLLFFLSGLNLGPFVCQT